MLHEPQPTAYDLSFRCMGIPVRVHPLFWLIACLLGWSDHFQLVILWIVAVFISILVHEMGHALCARHFGCQPWIVLHGFGGLAIYHDTYSMRVGQRVMIAFCGPLAGFLLAGATFFLYYQFFGSPSVFSDNLLLKAFFQNMLWINLAWGVINLVPVWPLDGGQISDHLLRFWFPSTGFSLSRKSSILFAVLLGLIAFQYLKQPYLGMMMFYLAFQNFQGLQSPFPR